MVGMFQVDLSEDLSAMPRIQEVRNERKWIAVLPGDTIQSPEVHTELKFT
jgi:hypothetical protein